MKNDSRNNKSSPFVPLTFCILWAGGILWGSLSPSPPSPPGVLAWDKLQHATAYGVGTLLTGRLFLLFARSEIRSWAWALVCTVLYGGLIEIAQGLFSAVRQAEFTDLLADAVGALLAVAAALVWRVVRRSRSGRGRR